MHVVLPKTGRGVIKVQQPAACMENYQAAAAERRRVEEEVRRENPTYAKHIDAAKAERERVCGKNVCGLAVEADGLAENALTAAQKQKLESVRKKAKEAFGACIY